jgi:hypothetical protein
VPHDYEKLSLEEIKKLYDAVEDINFDNPHEQIRTHHLRRFLDALTQLKELEIEIAIAQKEVADAKTLVEQDNSDQK